MKQFDTMKHKSNRIICMLLFMQMALLSGCSDPAVTFEEQDVFPEMEMHYKNHPSIPAKAQEDFERGVISKEEMAQKSKDWPKFFQRKTSTDVPANLVWENGMQLPDIGSPKAMKGGKYRSFLQDFPRTLRRVGPDANGSFRPFILDWTVMQFAQRHPVDTSLRDSGFHYFPGIAKSWAIDKENQTVYVRIHPDASWSDGKKITTEDVFFMFFFYQSEYIKAPWYKNYYNRTYENVTLYGADTFSIKLRDAKPDFVGRVLGLEPLPAHFFRELGPDYVERYQWRFVPTSGPYVIKDSDIRKGRSIALTRNPNWWAKELKFWRYRFNFDRIEMFVIRDVDKAFETFRKGDLDMFGLSLPRYWYVKLPDSDPLVQSGYIEKKVFYNDRPRANIGLWMNTSKPFLENRDVRLGIQFATNWKLVIDKHFRGDYRRIQTTSDGYGDFTAPNIKARVFNVKKALAHFARAGFNQRDRDGILVNDKGQRLSFTLTSGYQSLEAVLLILQEEALRAGLDFRVEILDATASWKKIQEKKHDIAFSGFGVSAEMYPRYWETYHSVNAYDQAFLPDGNVNPNRKIKTQTNNLNLIALQDMDKKIEIYRASENLKRMQKLAFQMEDILFKHASFSPGFSSPFFRTGHWRWIQFPEDFSVRLANGSLHYFLPWIDEELKKETLEGKKDNKVWEPVIKTYK